MSENKAFKDPLIVSMTLVVIVWMLGFNINSFYSHKNDKEVELNKIAMEREKITMERENNKLNVQLNIDKLTYCIQTVMESAIKSGKPIDVNKAKEICTTMEN